MRKFRLARLNVAVAAAAIVVFGGVAIASNMGFKMNRAVVQPNAFTGTAIPYFNPYGGDVKTFCTQTNLPRAIIPAPWQIQKFSTVSRCIAGGLVGGVCAPVGAACSPPAGGVCNRVSIKDPPILCSAAIGAATLPTPGEGFWVRSSGTAGPASIIIVGSHDPVRSITIPGRPTPALTFVNLSLPYHTTAVTARDVCVQAGLPLFPTGGAGGTLQRLNLAGTGFEAPYICQSSTAAPGFTLRLGDTILANQPTSGTTDKTFIPAHF